MHQSPARPFTQFSKRCRMYSGCHCSSRPRASSASRNSIGPDEPLPAGDDLERPVALLEELDGCVIGRGSPTDRPTRAAARRCGCGPSRPEAGHLVVGRLRRAPASRDSHPSLPQVTGRSVPFGCNHRAHRQRQLAPPGDVGEVAEGADHRDAAALLRVGQRMRAHRHRHAEERRQDVRAEERRYRSSSGCATSATQAGSSSGRVVSISKAPDPRAACLVRNRMRW
jgi:hypothetical protein